MATFHLDLVAPDKLAFAGEVDQVDLPCVEGDMGVLAGHAPMVVLLRPGILTIFTGGELREMVVFRGFAEVSTGGLTVLADLAASVEEFDRATLAARIREMEEKVRQTEPGSLLDEALQALDHFKAVDQRLTGTALH
jgi:F-type H+-transporting ATPase subunit epsilon